MNNKVKLKDRALATTLAIIIPAFPFIYLFPLFQGCGQIYNGQYKKGAGFFLFSAVNFMLLSVVDSETLYALAIAMLIVGYVLSIIDTNLSAKKINQHRLKFVSENDRKRQE